MRKMIVGLVDILCILIIFSLDKEGINLYDIKTGLSLLLNLSCCISFIMLPDLF